MHLADNHQLILEAGPKAEGPSGAGDRSEGPGRLVRRAWKGPKGRRLGSDYRPKGPDLGIRLAQKVLPLKCIFTRKFPQKHLYPQFFSAARCAGGMRGLRQSAP